MFRKQQHHPSESSLQFVTPNSRIIPATAPRDLTAMTPETQPNPQYYTAQLQQQHQSSSPYDTLYDTYGRDSLIDPIQNVAPSSGTSRQTFIEPNMSTMAPASVYGSQQFLDSGSDNYQSYYQSKHQEPSFADIDFFQNTSDMESINGSDIPVKRPSTIIEPRVQHVEIPVKIEQVNTPYPQASSATIEKAVYQNSVYDQQQYSHGGAGNGDDNFTLQLTPSRSTYSTRSSSITSSHSKSSKHPQQLTPLVIPPTPDRSVSSHNQNLNNATTPLSVQPQRSPLPSSSQLTPSLTPGSYGSSPRTVSPHTPSSARQYLASPSTDNHQQQQQPSTLSPSSNNQQQYQQNQQHQHQQQQQSGGSGKKKDEPVSEGEALLLEGIKYHESGKLEQATYYFHKASQLQLPMAMFFYGVSLRHGWGCQKNEPVAFQYIQKAAEHAVMDLNSLSKTVNTSASKGELIMSIYEMGISFRHGWGCRKNKETAVHFFKIAADLGDADAQNDLGHCYYHGHGVKKDVPLAAKYYRKADKQGHGIMGNSWIWKKKYDPK
ncbi:hypothetical protein BCR42DRAFT_451289 [Absidia repens]|uniref:HCP-like protein n=1 Tax=Absidia repens TaxID=90262 RepID=A0A1X2IIA9_9FUNG|nr:hypothetical protein BCR42DRAFT_451289 [Absidia repens]